MSSINKPLLIIIAYAFLLACNLHCGSRTTSTTKPETFAAAAASSNGDRREPTPSGGEPRTPMSLCDPDPVAANVGTPLFGQDASKWCWAGSAQMIFATTTVRDTMIRQCDMVKLTVPEPDCCGRTTPSPCDIIGYPPFSDFGVHADSTEDNTALPWDSTQRQIGCLRAPVCAKWRWTEDGQPTGTNHFVVLVSYEVRNGEPWVTILNPLPEVVGSIRSMPYSEFVQSTDVEPHVHGKDYYNIKKED